jgi:hypothetical protein
MRSALFVATLCLAACTRRAPQTETREPMHALRSPLSVKWLVKEQTDATLTLITRVDRHVPIRVPITVTVSVPPGASLVSGPAAFSIPSSEQAGPVEREMLFALSGLPADDFVLAADIDGADFGVHAKDTYNIAGVRPRPALRRADGPRLRLGGRSFGPSVLVEGRKDAPLHPRLK